MADTFPTCLAFTLQHEGAWSNDPRDPGGCTMQGITLPSFQQWKQICTLGCDDLRAITPSDVQAFYLAMQWQPLDAQNLPLGVDLMVFDAGVNMGIGRSAKILQQQIGVADDGVIGPATMTAVLAVEPATLIASLASAQTVFYHALADFSVFGTGWINRVNARQAAAVAMMSTS